MSQAGYGLVLMSQTPGKMYLSLIGPEPVTQTLSCELNLTETVQLCLFLKHSQSVALICNVASHNSNK